VWFDLFDVLQAVGRVDDAPQRVVDFCHNHQTLGPEVRRGRTQFWFGRATPFDALANVLFRRRGARNVATDAHVRTNLSRLLTRPLAAQRRRLRGKYLAEYLMWVVYQDGHATDPWSGVDMVNEALRNRLGLGHLAQGTAVVYWAHALPSGMTAHKPTALDAEANQFWEPGGLTKPLHGGGQGLPEAVHRAIMGEQLKKPIQRGR